MKTGFVRAIWIWWCF